MSKNSPDIRPKIIRRLEGKNFEIFRISPSGEFRIPALAKAALDIESNKSVSRHTVSCHYALNFVSVTLRYRSLPCITLRYFIFVILVSCSNMMYPQVETDTVSYPQISSGTLRYRQVPSGIVKSCTVRYQHLIGIR